MAFDAKAIKQQVAGGSRGLMLRRAAQGGGLDGGGSCLRGAAPSLGSALFNAAATAAPQLHVGIRLFCFCAAAPPPLTAARHLLLGARAQLQRLGRTGWACRLFSVQLQGADGQPAETIPALVRGEGPGSQRCHCASVHWHLRGAGRVVGVVGSWGACGGGGSEATGCRGSPLWPALAVQAAWLLARAPAAAPPDCTSTFELIRALPGLRAPVQPAGAAGTHDGRHGRD